jgi:hypothetical protein
MLFEFSVPVYFEYEYFIFFKFDSMLHSDSEVFF